MLFLLLCLAQEPVALASVSAPTVLPSDPTCLPGALLRRRQGSTGAVFFPQAAWQAMVGDLDGDGLFDMPPDVDALTEWPPSGSLGFDPTDLAFSTARSGPGFEDGDILRLSPLGGFDVLVSEATFLQAILPASGYFDLDALAKDGQGNLWFSLRDSLGGTVLGDLEDGDILMLDPLTGTVSRPWTESQVQSMVDQALGTSAAFGDVKTLAFDPTSGDLLFGVQSPSSQDATVFSTRGGGEILSGWSESDWGFQSAAELDAFCFLSQPSLPAPVLSVQFPYLTSGVADQFRLRHGTPNGLAKGMVATSFRFQEMPGWGAGFTWLNPSDPWFGFQWRNTLFHRTRFDSSGSLTYRWTPPPPAPWNLGYNLWVQALDVESRSLSAPLVVRIS